VVIDRVGRPDLAEAVANALGIPNVLTQPDPNLFVDVTVVTPDRVVIGGGIAAAADLLLEPIRDELRRRVHTTSLEPVEILSAELGTWAGSIGAAVHGAEMMQAGQR
jgi:predicted NBD/HSP70 family sugar kinase